MFESRKIEKYIADTNTKSSNAYPLDIDVNSQST